MSHQDIEELKEEIDSLRKRLKLVLNQIVSGTFSEFDLQVTAYVHAKDFGIELEKKRDD